METLILLILVYFPVYHLKYTNTLCAISQSGRRIIPDSSGVQGMRAVEIRERHLQCVKGTLVSQYGDFLHFVFALNNKQSLRPTLTQTPDHQSVRIKRSCTSPLHGGLAGGKVSSVQLCEKDLLSSQIIGLYLSQSQSDKPFSSGHWYMLLIKCRLNECSCSLLIIHSFPDKREQQQKVQIVPFGNKSMCHLVLVWEFWGFFFLSHCVQSLLSHNKTFHCVFKYLTDKGENLDNHTKA